MIQVNLLEARMKEKNVWYKDLAKAINMSYQVLKGRCWGRTDFTRKEIIKIMEFLGLSMEQTIEIFF